LLPRLKSEAQEKERELQELIEKRAALLKEKEEKMMTLKASKDKNTLKTLLEPSGTIEIIFHHLTSQTRSKKNYEGLYPSYKMRKNIKRLN
jgi:hypothetical protein